MKQRENSDTNTEATEQTVTRNAFESERRNASSKERGKAKGNHRQLMLILFPSWICFPGTHVATAVAVGAKNAAQTAFRLPHPPDPLDLLSRAAGRQRRVSEVRSPCPEADCHVTIRE